MCLPLTSILSRSQGEAKPMLGTFCANTAAQPCTFLTAEDSCTLPRACPCLETGRQLFDYIQFADGFTGFMASAGVERYNKPSFQYLMAFGVIHTEKKQSKYQSFQFLHSEEIKSSTRTVTYKSISLAF